MQHLAGANKRQFRFIRGDSKASVLTAVIECLIYNSYFFYANFFLFKYFFCRVRYCVTFIVAVGTLLLVVKLGKIFIVSRSIGCKPLITRSGLLQ